MSRAKKYSFGRFEQGAYRVTRTGDGEDLGVVQRTCVTGRSTPLWSAFSHDYRRHGGFVTRSDAAEYLSRYLDKARVKAVPRQEP